MQPEIKSDRRPADTMTVNCSLIAGVARFSIPKIEEPPSHLRLLRDERFLVFRGGRAENWAYSTTCAMPTKLSLRTHKTEFIHSNMTLSSCLNTRQRISRRLLWEVPVKECIYPKTYRRIDEVKHFLGGGAGGAPRPPLIYHVILLYRIIV